MLNRNEMYSSECDEVVFKTFSFLVLCLELSIDLGAESLGRAFLIRDRSKLFRTKR